MPFQATSRQHHQAPGFCRVSRPWLSKTRITSFASFLVPRIDRIPCTQWKLMKFISLIQLDCSGPVHLLFDNSVSPRIFPTQQIILHWWVWGSWRFITPIFYGWNLNFSNDNPISAGLSSDFFGILYLFISHSAIDPSFPKVKSQSTQDHHT